jgi:CheY-like chemotaxis protein
MTALREITFCQSFPALLMELAEPPTHSNTGTNASSVDVTYEALASKKPQKRTTSTRVRKRTKQVRSPRGTVLVVDDVPDVTEMIELLLKHAGYDVATAGSAKAALQMARQQHFDLVISDIGMPEMNGYELASALRDLAAYNSTPLIAVTGYSEYDDRGRAVRAGFNVHLAKPIEPSQLLNLMNELLSQTEPRTNH